MLSNAYFLAKFRFDTAENEPDKSLQTSEFFANFANTQARSGRRGGLLEAHAVEVHERRGDAPGADGGVVGAGGGVEAAVALAAPLCGKLGRGRSRRHRSQILQ